MRFTGKLAHPILRTTTDEKGLRDHTSLNDVVFSKYRIYSVNKESPFPIFYPDIRHGDKYRLKKLDREHHIHNWSKDARYQAIFAGGVELAIITDTKNLFLLRIIHNRLWIQRNWEWFLKTVIAILFGALISIFSRQAGYKEGQASIKKATDISIPPATPQSKAK